MGTAAVRGTIVSSPTGSIQPQIVENLLGRPCLDEHEKSTSKTGGQGLRDCCWVGALRFTVQYIACSRRAACLFGSNESFSL